MSRQNKSQLHNAVNNAWHGLVDSKKGEIPASSENKLAWRWGSGWKFDLPFWQTFRSMDYELFTTVWNIVKTIVSVGFSNISIKSVTQSKVVRNIYWWYNFNFFFSKLCSKLCITLLSREKSILSISNRSFINIRTKR